RKITYAVTRKDAGICKRIVGETKDLTKLKILVQAYLQMRDSFFIKKAYDITTFEQNFASINQFAQSGKLITKVEANRIEEKAHGNAELSEYELMRRTVESEIEQELIERKESDHEKKQLIQ